MKTLAAAIILILATPFSETAHEGNVSQLVLPNTKLLKCRSADCSRLWPDQSISGTVVFPKQVILDTDRGCPYGMTAMYDKSVALDEVAAAIDRAYGQSAIPHSTSSKARLWRFDSQRFAIQLTVADEKDEKRNFAEVGTKVAIYLAFGGKSACGSP